MQQRAWVRRLRLTAASRSSIELSGSFPLPCGLRAYRRARSSRIQNTAEARPSKPQPNHVTPVARSTSRSPRPSPIRRTLGTLAGARDRQSGHPDAVLAYLARYTHRVAIANSRLVALDER